MQIKFCCPHWGSENLNLSDFYQKVAQAGYDGVERTLKNEKEAEENLEFAQKHDFLFIAQYADSFTASFEEYFEHYQKRLEFLASYKPYFINAQTGKDYYTFEENKKLIDLATKTTQKTGVPIVHETHRGKFSFAAHITKVFLEQIPEIQITADFSHWCNVAESLLADQEEAINLAIQKAVHRVFHFFILQEFLHYLSPMWLVILPNHFQYFLLHSV